MESWRHVWRSAVEPLLSDGELEALAAALERDDPRLGQGFTTTPPPLSVAQAWPVEAACALSYCGWQGGGLDTVGEVEEYFARMCYAIDQKLGEPAGCRWFINWWDGTPRGEAVPALLAEVKRSLRFRANGEDLAGPDPECEICDGCGYQSSHNTAPDESYGDSTDTPCPCRRPGRAAGAEGQGVTTWA